MYHIFRERNLATKYRLIYTKLVGRPSSFPVNSSPEAFKKEGAKKPNGKRLSLVKFGHCNIIALKKTNGQTWLDMAKFISQLSALIIKSEKDLDQVKTKTRFLERAFKDMKAHMNWTGKKVRQGKCGRNLWSSWSKLKTTSMAPFLKI